MQHRYKLSDAEILEMPYARFLERVNVASSAVNSSRREALERVTLQGWLGHIAFQGKIEWLDYRAMVLGDPDAGASDVTLEQALAIAERVAAMDRVEREVEHGDL